MTTEDSQIRKTIMKPNSQKQSRVEIYRQIAKMTGLKRIQVESVFGALSSVISTHLHDEGSGVVSIPGLVKIRRVNRKRTKEREMLSPLTGTVVQIRSKPERSVLKLLPLKPLREMLGDATPLPTEAEQLADAEELAELD